MTPRAVNRCASDPAHGVTRRTVMGGQIAAGACLLAAAAVLTACGGAAPEPGPLATYRPEGEGGDGALLEGVLELRDGCVVVVVGESVVVPVFPDRYSWDDGARGVVTDGEVLLAGAAVALGGGYGSEPPEGASVPTGCDVEAEFFVVAQTVA